MIRAKKKHCPFKSGKRSAAEVDYKNKALRKFINDTGRIVANRITGLSPFWQRRVATEVKYARYLGMMPYCDRH